MRDFKIRKRVSKIPLIGKRHSAGVGYLIVPEDIDRDLYIKNAFSSKTVSFITFNSERYDNIYVNKSIFQDLEFPARSEDLGSLIFWASTPKQGLPVIIAVLNDAGTVGNLLEHQFLLSKNTTEGTVEISGDAKKGIINILVDSSEDIGGELNINIVNKAGTGKVNITTDGDFNFDIGNDVNLTIGEKFYLKIANLIEDEEAITEIIYERGVGFSLIDEFGNKIFTKETGIEFGEGSESGALGDTLVSLMEELSDILSGGKTSTSLGPQPFMPDTQVKIKLWKDKLKNIKSELVKLD